METHTYVPTTPFGPRVLSDAVLRTQRAVRECPAGQPVHKWKVFRLVCEAKQRLGVSDRALAVLDALISFHPDTVLVGGDTDLVVFPSNRHLALRAHGIAPSTLRRHLAALVEAGLVLRRDSPNGKRYARRDGAGEVGQAFGFDLGPLVARADEFAGLADIVRTERRALTFARERVTLLRRDIAKSIAAGIALKIPADWPALKGAFSGLVARLDRKDDGARFEAVAEDLQRLAAAILILLERHVEPEETSTRESHSGRHIQSSKPDPLAESEPVLREGRGRTVASNDDAERVPPTTVQLGLALKACPDLADYARHGITSWRDLVATAALVRPMLGISSSAWKEACAVLGEPQAAVVLACMLQRSDAIRAPGGYLRDLTRRARGGAFSVAPMVMALIGMQDRRSRVDDDGTAIPPGMRVPGAAGSRRETTMTVRGRESR